MEKMMETNLTKLKNPPVLQTEQQAQAGFFNTQSFDLIQRVAKGFASSDMVPAQYQGNVANCMIALDMAGRIGASPLSVMQNMFVVYGTPSWSAKFLIATLNACGRYSSLRYEWKGEPGNNDYGCRAWAIEHSTGERLDGIWVTWEMVEAEGWSSKKGSKWLTMPDQMFVYRAATFWVRAYAPELSMGLSTVEEVQDAYDTSRDKEGVYSVELNDLRPSINPDTGEITSGNEEEEDTAKAQRKAERKMKKLEQDAEEVKQKDQVAPKEDPEVKQPYKNQMDLG
jgi:hypothetical protein